MVLSWWNNNALFLATIKIYFYLIIFYNMGTHMKRRSKRKSRKSRKRRGGRILSKDEVATIKTAQDQTHKEAQKAMGEIAKAQSKMRRVNVKAMTDVFDKKRTMAKGKLAAEAAA